MESFSWYKTGIAKVISALTLCFVMLFALIGAVCLPATAYAVTESDLVDDDAVLLKTDPSIALFANITFKPELPTSGEYLDPNATYTIHFDVDEANAKGVQTQAGKFDFLFDVTGMYYYLPEGLNYTLTFPKTGRLQLYAKDYQLQKQFLVEADVSIQNEGGRKVLVVKWDQSSPGWYLLAISTNAKYTLEVKASVNDGSDLIDFGDGKKYYVDNTAKASVTKKINTDNANDVFAAELRDSLTEAQKKEFKFTLQDVYVAKTTAGEGETTDAQGFVRNAQGHIVYDGPKDVTIDLSQMTWDEENGHYYYEFNEKLKPTGEKIVVTEDNCPKALDGYVWNADSSVTNAQSAETLTGGSHRIVSLVNMYTEEKAKLKITKNFGSGSDITADSLTYDQKENIKFTVQGTKANGKAYGPDTYTYNQLANMKWELNLPAGTYKVTESAGFTNYDWTVIYETGIGAGMSGKQTGTAAATGDVKVDAGQTGVFIFTNTYDQHLGGLKLNKTVTGLTMSSEQKQGTTFTISHGSTNLTWTKQGNNYVYDPNGGVTAIPYSAFVDDSVTLTGMPVGTYTVTETNPTVAGYSRKTTVAVNSGSATENTSASVRVSKDQTATVSYTNTYTEKAKITVSKKVAGSLNLNNVNDSLKFKLERKVNDQWTAVYSDVYLSNGAITWDNLPFGEYRVTEVAAAKPNYSMSTSITVTPANGANVNDTNKSATFTLSAANNSVATSFTNTYTPKTTELTINKSMAGTYPSDATSKIKFTVSNGNSTLKWKKVTDNEYAYDVNGSTDIPYGTSIKLTGLPAGYTYTVTETTGSNSYSGSYIITTTANGSSGTSASVKLEETKGEVNKGTVNFVNTYRPVAKISIRKSFTGVLSDAYVNNEILLPKLRFVVSKVESGTTLYLTASGTWVSEKQSARQFYYTELSTGLEVDAYTTYYIEELNAEVDGFTVSTWWSEGENGEPSKVTDTNRPTVEVTPGQPQVINFINDYRDDGVVPVASAQLHTKTWAGLTKDKEDAVRKVVSFKLEYKDGNTWSTYDTYTLAELTAGKKTYDAPDGTSVELPITLPAGEYRLTEEEYAVDGYDHAVFIIIVENGDLNHAQTKLMENKQVTFTAVDGATYQFGLANVYTPKGALQVKKTIVGVDGNYTKNISFKLSRKLGENGQVEDIETFNLNHFSNGVYTKSDLPVGVYRSNSNGTWTLVDYIYIVSEVNADVDQHTLASTTVKVNNGTATTASSGQVTLAKDGTSTMTVEFTNTYTRNKGDLSVQKTISGDIPEAEADKITFQVKDSNGNVVKWNEEDGQNVYVDGNAGSKFSFTYADMINGKFTIKEIPTGTYKLVESNADIPGYKRMTVFSVSGSGNESGNIQVNAGTTAEVTVTNTYTPVGSVKIVKKIVVDGNGFSQAYNLGNLRDIAFRVYKGQVIGANYAMFTLKGCEAKKVSATEWEFSITYTDLEPGIYTLVEENTAVAGYQFQGVTIENGTRVADINGNPAFEVNVESNGGTAIVVNITNTYKEMGKLSISKTFTGIVASKLTSEQKNSIVFGLFDEQNNLISAKDGDAITSGDYKGWVSYAKMNNGSYTWENLDVSKKYYIKEFVIGEDNANTATNSTFYGYVHTQTSWSGATTGTATNVPGVVQTGMLTVNKAGVNVSFNNRYEEVKEVDVGKKGQNFSSNLVDASGLPVWHFTITVNNVGAGSLDQNGQLIINDEFDNKNKEWFKLVDVDGFTPAITQGEHVSLAATDHGDGTATYVITLQEGAPANQTVIFTYYLQPKDKATFQEMLRDTKHRATSSTTGATWTYTNTITYKPLPNEAERTISATYYYNTDMITKTMTANNGDMTVSFKLEINPDALYIGQNDRLIVLDRMSDNVEVNMSSFVVTPPSEAANVKVSLYEGDDWDIQIEVPNGKKLEITYEATIQDPSGKVNVTNTVSMEGVIEEVGKDIEFEGGNSGTMSVGAVAVFKYGDTMTMPLQGAKFALYQCEDSKHEAFDTPKFMAEFTSNANGIVAIQSWRDGYGRDYALQWDILYYIVEIAAPEGYEMGAPDERIYFRIYEDEANRHKDENGEVLPCYVKTGKVFNRSNASLRAEAALTAQKTVKGAALGPNNLFTFQLLDGEENALQTKNNAQDGTITFDKLTYSYEKFTEQEKLAGQQVHTYKIKEVNDKKPGYTYDVTEYDVTVTVSTVKTDGKVTALQTTVVYSKDGIAVTTPNFENTYTTKGEVKLQVSKALKTNQDSYQTDEVFTFNLYDAADKLVGTATAKAGQTALFDPITYNVPGEYTYTIQEAEPATKTPGISYDTAKYPVTVTMTDNGDGTMSSRVTYPGDDDDLTITNIYSEAHVSLRVKKTVAGNVYGTGYNPDEVFNFLLLAEDGQTVVDSVSCKAGETVSFNNEFVYYEPGTHTFYIQEVAGTTAGMIYDSTKHPVMIKVEKDAQGYLKSTVTYADSISDAAQVITNTYCETAFVPEAAKKVVGTNAPAETFTFQLLDANDKVIDSAICQADGTATFDKIAYNQAGTYTYFIQEVTPENKTPGMTYSTEKIKLVVNVEFDEDGELVATGTYSGGAGEDNNTITNTYKRPVGKAELSITKRVIGDPYYPDGTEHYFGIMLSIDENPLTSQTNNTTDTTVQTIEGKDLLNGEDTTVFTIEYDMPGTYHYTIEEINGSIPGMEYDKTVYHVTIDVHYAEDLMSLVSTVYCEETKASTVVVTNKYSNIEFTPEVNKLLVGDLGYEEIFTFKLVDENGQEQTASCVQGGTAKFEGFTYNTTGEYTYTIQEVIPAEADKVQGMVYSTEVIAVKVKVLADPATNALSVEAVYTGGSGDKGNTITNTYNKPVGNAAIAVTKAMTGDTNAAHYNVDEEFTFTLTKGENETTTATNNVVAEAMPQQIAVGEHAVWNITYDAEGTYTYTIQETKGTTPGMAYDDTVYNVTVVVAYNPNTLKLDTTVTYNGVAAKNLTVTNEYSEISFAPVAMKGINATTPYALPETEFTFELTTTLDDGTAHTERKTVKYNEEVKFSDIVYHLPGEYTISIKEIAPDEKVPGMTYSAEGILCTVKVVRADDGKLSLFESYKVGNKVSNTITNTFVLPVGEVELVANKIVSGNQFDANEKFEFVLTGFASDGTNNRLDNTPAAQTLKKDGTVSWKIKYDLPGEYRYIIQETLPEEVTPGMVYDLTEYEVVVVMDYDKETGSTLVPVSVTYNGVEAKDLTVTNKFSEITFQPEIIKALADKTLNVPEAVFNFDLVQLLPVDAVYTDEAQALIIRAEGDETEVLTAKAVFQALTYNEPGVYSYAITEIIPAADDKEGAPGMTYSDEEIIYTVVVVRDEATGELKIESETYTGNDGEGDNTITNTYAKPDVEVTLQVRKLISGNVDVYKNYWNYNFKLTPTTEHITLLPDNDVVMESLTQKIKASEVDENGNLVGDMAKWTIGYTQPGIYTYTIQEYIPIAAAMVDGVEYNLTVYPVTVIVEYSEDLSELVAEVIFEGDDAVLTKDKTTLLVTNKFSEISFQPEIKKTLVGADLLKEAFEFKLQQTKPEPTAEGEELYSEVIIIEMDPEAYAMELTNIGRFKKLTYHEPGTYEYEIVEIKPEADKRTPGMSYSEEKVIYTVVVEKNEETGELTIASEKYVTLNKVVLEEKPVVRPLQPGMGDAEMDGGAEAVPANFESAKDNDPVEGNTFTNVYKRPEGEAQVIVNKAMTGNEYKGDDKFAFVLSKYEIKAEEELPEEKPEERPEEKPGEEAEEPNEEVVVPMPNSRSLDGVVTTPGGNTYPVEPGTPVDPETPVGPETNNVILPEEKLATGVSGSVVWTIKYDQPGTYYYTIQEINGGEEGVTYDETLYYVTVVVDYVVDGDGDRMSLMANVSYSTVKPGTEEDAEQPGEDAEDPSEGDAEVAPKPGLTITNKYSKVAFNPVVSKKVNGRGAPDETFTFQLFGSDGYTDTAHAKDGEEAIFKTIIYHEPGEYTYTIFEVEPQYKTHGMTYSDEAVVVAVKIERNDETGELTVKSVAYTNDATFINRYEPPITYDYKFSFTKKWQGGIEESIEWTLYNPDGTVAHKKFNKQIVDEREWYYEGWFATNKDYYIIEDVPEGYEAIYINVGEFADVTDRLHNGGTLINYKVPQTGDRETPVLWAGLMAISAAVLLLIAKRRKLTRG